MAITKYTGRAYTDAEIIEALTALAKVSGSPILASQALARSGSGLNQNDIRVIRDENSSMYTALASDYAKQVEDGIAQKFREVGSAASDMTRDYVELLHAKLMEDGLPENPERLLMALTRVQQVSTDKLLSITGRPVGGQATDPMEAAKELVRLGVLKPVEIEAPVEGSAEEDE